MKAPSRYGSVTAACEVCGQPLPAGRPRRTCSDRCRQAAWRRRHCPPSSPQPLPAARSRTEHTVYACPNCQARQLGVQRCQDCGVFMARLGLGGHCSGCDELLTVEELLNS